MFGENYILGKKSIKMDDKGRIILPSFTYAEPKEDIVFMISDNMEYINLFSKNDIVNKLDILVSKQAKVQSSNEFNLIQAQINMFQNYCFGYSSVDGQRRVLIPNSLREKILSSNEIFVNGSVALQLPCLEVYQSEEHMLKLNIRGKNFI